MHFKRPHKHSVLGPLLFPFKFAQNTVFVAASCVTLLGASKAEIDGAALAAPGPLGAAAVPRGPAAPAQRRTSRRADEPKLGRKSPPNRHWEHLFTYYTPHFQ